MCTRRRLIKLLALLTVVALPVTASAQAINLGTMLNNAINNAKTNQQTPGAQGLNLPGATTKADSKIWRGNAQPLYRTKAEFIAAAQNGDLLGLANVYASTARIGADGEMQDRLSASIAVILADDYRTGVPADTWCATRFAEGSAGVMLLQQVTALYTMTLTDAPPDFTYGNADKVTRARENADRWANSLFRECANKVLGTDQPYPMVESLKDLLRTYAATTKEVVEAKRAERVQAYQVAQQRQQEAQQRAAADKAKAEQQRIDAERKRIEKEQQDQKARDDARVSG